MWSVALAFVGWAHAACPDVDSALRSAENDVVSYFLADAQVALDEAVVGMGCSEVENRQLARYWQTQAMVWQFSDDPRADGAFAASRRDDPSYFFADFGDDARARWEAATVPEGEGAPLVLKGMRPTETVWLDGAVLEGSAPLGWHVVQVGDGTPRFAKVVPVEGADVVTVVVPALAAEVAPEPAPVPVPVIGPAPPPTAPAGFAGPLTHTGRRVMDVNGLPLHWRRDVKTLARRHGVGADALAKMRQNTLKQVSSSVLTVGGAYGTYLFGWELLYGRSREPSTMTTGATISALVALTGSLGLLRLQGERRQLRTQLVQGATLALENR